MKTIEVVAAIIQNKNTTLCAQRGPSKFEYVSHKYEFPGGKIENGETKEEAIIREIQEELKLNIESPEFYMTVQHSYPDFHLIMHSFICQINHTRITLTEHINVEWLTLKELNTLDLSLIHI